MSQAKVASRPKLTQAHNYCFTLNNWVEDDLFNLQQLADPLFGVSDKRLTYLVFGFEYTKSGIPHLQGYVEFNHSIRFDVAKNLISQRAHLKPRRGTGLQASNYCKKGKQSKSEWKKFREAGPNFGLEAEFYEFGNLKIEPSKAHRTDVQLFLELVREGATDLELMEIDFGAYSRMMRAIDRLRILTMQVDRTEPRKVVLLCGSTGAGKTLYAKREYPGIRQVHLDKQQWYDGITAMTKAVLFDEFRGQMTFDTTMRVFDPWHIQFLPIKGGFTWYNPDTIVVTSNKLPWDWYNFGRNPDDKRPLHDATEEDALRRRFNFIYICTSRGLFLVDKDKFWPARDLDEQLWEQFVPYSSLPPIPPPALTILNGLSYPPIREESLLLDVEGILYLIYYLT